MTFVYSRDIITTLIKDQNKRETMQYAIELFFNDEMEKKILFSSIGLVKVPFPVEEIFTVSLKKLNLY